MEVIVVGSVDTNAGLAAADVLSRLTLMTVPVADALNLVGVVLTTLLLLHHDGAAGVAADGGEVIADGAGVVGSAVLRRREADGCREGENSCEAHGGRGEGDSRADAVCCRCFNGGTESGRQRRGGAGGVRVL